MGNTSGYRAVYGSGRDADGQDVQPTLPKGEMTKSMVNNYVKVGMIPRPTGKKYDRDHLAMLIMIGVLKQALSMESIRPAAGGHLPGRHTGRL